MKESIDKKYKEGTKRVIMTHYPEIDGQKQFVRRFKEEYREKIPGVLKWDREPSCSSDSAWQKELRDKYEDKFYKVKADVQKALKDDALVKEIIDYFQEHQIPIAKKHRIHSWDIDLRKQGLKPYQKLEGITESLVRGSMQIVDDYKGIVEIIKQHIDVPEIAKDIYVLHQTEVIWATHDSEEMLMEHILGVEQRSVHTYTSCEHCEKMADTSSQEWESLIGLGLIHVGKCDAQPYSQRPADFYHIDKVYEKIARDGKKVKIMGK